MEERPTFENCQEIFRLYEVIRVINGVPVFLEDHMDRLFHSALLTGTKLLPDRDSLTGMIKKYLSAQKEDTGNIKLLFTISDLLAEPLCELNFIPHFYPSEKDYIHGVKVGLLHADRPVPNAKIQNIDIRDKANYLIKENNLFEVLLIDSDGNITEGSRSNVFFIKKNQLYTAPGEKILRGITWIKVLQICKSAGIQLIEADIPANRLDQYDAAFLSGTSPKVLPICSIDKKVYKTDHPLLIEIQNAYNKLIENYLRGKR